MMSRPNRSDSDSSSSVSSNRVAIPEEGMNIQSGKDNRHSEEVEVEDNSPLQEEDASADLPGHSRQRRHSSSSWGSSIPDAPVFEEEDLEERFRNQPQDEQGIPEAIITPVRPVIGPRSRGFEGVHGRQPFDIPSATGIPYHYEPQKPILRDPTSKEACRLMVDYLISEGYKDVAQTLCKEADLELPVDQIRHLDGRVAVREAIISGDLKEAIRLIQDLCPGLMEFDSNVRFNLHQQNVIEMIRKRSIEEVLVYAEEHISADEEWDADQLDRLERTFALLAFEDPTESPFGETLSMDHRQKISTEINSAVLRYQNRPSAPRLEAILRMVTWGQQQLLEKTTGRAGFDSLYVSNHLFNGQPRQPYTLQTANRSGSDYGTSI